MEEKVDKVLDQKNPAEEIVEPEVDAVVETAAEVEEEVAIELTEEESLKELADSLREEIAALEVHEKKLAEKLCEVKRKGLPEAAAKCRELLQRMVRERMAKQADLKDVEESYREAKARRELVEVNAEVAELTEQIERDFFEAAFDPLEKPTFEPAYDHFAKAKRLSVRATATALIGILTGLLGLIVYLSLVVMWGIGEHLMGVAFAAFGVVAVATTVVGLFIGRRSNFHRKKGEELKAEIALKMAEYEAELLERERMKSEMETPWHLENLDAATEVQRLERENDVAFANAEAKKTKKQRDLLYGVDTVELAKRHRGKLASVALAGTAVLAALALSKAKEKKNRISRSAAIRNEIRSWLDL